MPHLGAKTLRELLDYNPDTGVLVWKPRALSWFRSGKYSAERICATWNSKHAHKEAGSINPDGYRCVTILGRTYAGHTVAWKIHTGQEPEGEIDHENGRRDDNRIVNLRDVSRSLNTQNQRKYRTNTSGHVGVKWSAKMQKWEAQIGSQPRVYLGIFDNLEAAVAARKKAEREHGYHRNHGRHA